MGKKQAATKPNNKKGKADTFVFDEHVQEEQTALEKVAQSLAECIASKGGKKDETLKVLKVRSSKPLAWCKPGSAHGPVPS